MKVLITGAGGALGIAFHDCSRAEHETHALSNDQLNVTNPLQVSLVIKHIRPDVIIYCAAFSQMDEAEIEREQAFRINALGVRNVAIAQRIGAKFVYPSTSAVFDGRKSVPHVKVVHIGDGATIVANSLVVSDIPPLATAMGIPACNILPKNVLPLPKRNSRKRGGRDQL